MQLESGSEESKLLTVLGDFTTDDFLYTGSDISEICGFPCEPKDMSFDLCKLIITFWVKHTSFHFWRIGKQT